MGFEKIFLQPATGVSGWHGQTLFVREKTMDGGVSGWHGPSVFVREKAPLDGASLERPVRRGGLDVDRLRSGRVHESQGFCQ
jgi:hypothetical protein